MANTSKVNTNQILTFVKGSKRTVGDIAEKFGVTAATARKYVEAMLNEGTLTAAGVKETGTRGRPATLFQA